MDARARMLLCVLAGLVLSMPAGTTTAPAGAAAPGSLIDDILRLRPRGISDVRVPRTTRLAPPEANEYGVVESVVPTLDDAKLTAADKADSASATVTVDPAAADYAKGCAAEAFQAAGEDFIQAAEEGGPYPAFGDAFYYAVKGCLSETFPGDSDQAVEVAAQYMTGEVDPAAQEVIATAPEGLASWASATADEVAPPQPEPEPEPIITSEPPTTPDPPAGDGGGGSSPPWGLIAVFAALAIGGGIYGHYRDRQGG